MLHPLPNAKTLLGDKRYDANWFRDALARRKIQACIPSRADRKIAIPYDQTLYKKRREIENMFGSLTNWSRIHTRYDRCAHIFFSSICLAVLLKHMPRSGHNILALI